MKHKKTSGEPRWIVATKTEKPPRGFSKNEIFGFPTKRDAVAFIKDITSRNVEWMMADAREAV